MLDALPGHVGDMQQTVDAAEVNKSTVVGEVLDDTLDLDTFLQTFKQCLALSAVLVLDHGTTRDNDVVTTLIQLDDLELQIFSFQIGGIAYRAHINQ